MLKHLKPKSEFSQNVLTLMTGTTIAQAIPIAISPILTRLYTPSDFGLLALYMSIASLLSVIATGRYELAIMLPKKESDALNIVALSLLITFFISFMALVIIYLFNEQIALLLNNKNISNWLYFVPLTVLLTGFYQSFNYWDNCKKQYKQISKSRVLQSSATGVSNVTFGYTGFTYGGLILGGVIGQAFSTSFLGRKFYQSEKQNFELISKSKMVILAKKYKKFPLINSVHAFINIVKENAVNIFLAIKYSQSILGYYFFMMKLMKLPAGLLGSSLAQVFYREASEKYNKDKNIQTNVLNLIKKLIAISIIPIVFFYFIAEDLFRIVFGEEWIIAGNYAKAVTPYIFFHFIASPLGMVPLMVNKQEKAFVWGLVESILFICIFIFGYFFYIDLVLTLYILSIVMPLYFITYFMWIYKIAKGKL